MSKQEQGTVIAEDQGVNHSHHPLPDFRAIFFETNPVFSYLI
jgi:hypothetical protein